MEKGYRSFNPETIAKDIVNVLANHKAPINSVDRIFAAVTKEIERQTVTAVSDVEIVKKD